MAKKRIITQDMNFDEDFNKLPMNSQILFYRFLTISDDCGVIPANEYTLHSMLNTPPEIKRNYSKLLQNILDLKLMFKFQHNGKDFLCFKRHSFDEMQKFLIKNRTRSEYLKVQKEEFFNLYCKLQEITVNYKVIVDNNIEYKDIDKEKDKEPAKKILFSETEFYNNYDLFKDQFISNEKYKKYDADYYFESVKNWSDSKGEKRINWIATAYSFVRRDGDKAKLSTNKPSNIISIAE